MSKKITNKTIEEETDLVPYIIAEIAAEKAVGYGMKRELDTWKDLNEEQRKDLDERYKKELQAVIDYMVLRADTTFQYNERFRKNVKSKKNNGNYGRDHLYMFMYHWVGVHEGFTTEASSYKRAMVNYYKAIELHAKQN